MPRSTREWRAEALEGDMADKTEELREPLLEGVREIDAFRAHCDETGEGTDPDAAWELIDNLRSRLASALSAVGVDVPAYGGPETPAAPGR